jgi:hypothetical protein
MFFDTWPHTRSTKYCVSIFVALSMSRGGHRRALELLAQVRRERGQVRRERRVRRGAAGDLVALDVPGLHGLGVGPDPRLRGGEQLLRGGDQLVDQAQLLGLGGLVPLALEEHVEQSALDAQQAHGARHATAAGQQSQAHLGQADLAALGVERDAVVGGEGDLVAAAERGAVDGRHDRLAQLLQAPHVRLHAVDHLRDLGGGARPGGAELVEVAACEEGLLGGGDHDAGDGVLLGLQPVDRRPERLPEGVVHGVRGLVRVVHGEHDDAVGVGLPLDHVLGHVPGLRLAR